MAAGRWVAILVGVLLVSLAPLPVGQAAFSDTYVVTGRVLDEGGLPAGEVPVRIEFEGADAGPAQVHRTSCQGDFQARFQVGDVEGARIRVSAEGQTVTQGVSTLVRRSFIGFQVPDTHAPEGCEPARESFGRSHVVTGRVLDTEGRPIVGADVEVRMDLVSGGNLSGHATTDDAGTFTAGFQSSRISQGGTAVVSATGQRWSEPLDERYGVTVADHIEQEPGFSVSIPWKTIGLVLGTLVGLLALVGGVFYLLHRPGKKDDDRG